MHPCPRSWVAIRRVVVYYTRADHTLSVGIKRQHCGGAKDLIGSYIKGYKIIDQN